MIRSSASWLPGETLTRRFAVDEPMLLRYAKRGILGARWDETEGLWLFEVERISQLFLPRGVDCSTPAPHLGFLGTACLAGRKKRKLPVVPERRTAATLNSHTRCA